MLSPVVFGGLVTALVIFIATRRIEYIRFTKEKCEQLFLASSEYQSSMVGFFMHLEMQVAGKLNEKDLVELSKNMDGNHDCHLRVKMLLSLYFPTLNREFDDWMESRAQVVNAEIKHKKGIEISVLDFQQLVNQHAYSFEVFQAAIIDFAASIHFMSVNSAMKNWSKTFRLPTKVDQT